MLTSLLTMGTSMFLKAAWMPIWTLRTSAAMIPTMLSRQSLSSTGRFRMARSSAVRFRGFGFLAQMLKTTAILDKLPVSVQLERLLIIDALALALMTEWARARARAARWSEELQLLCEEMRRTLAYTSWKATWWAALARSAPKLPPSHTCDAIATAGEPSTPAGLAALQDAALLEGRTAYALEHAAQELAFRSRCVAKFRPVLLAAKATGLVPRIDIPEPISADIPDDHLEINPAPLMDESDDDASEDDA
jgi:hypothetical protein